MREALCDRHGFTGYLAEAAEAISPLRPAKLGKIASFHGRRHIFSGGGSEDAVVLVEDGGIRVECGASWLPITSDPAFDGGGGFAVIGFGVPGEHFEEYDGVGERTALGGLLCAAGAGWEGFAEGGFHWPQV